MSIGKRILTLARANLNALLDRAETSVDELTDEELEAELELRRARRRREEQERKEREAAERAARERAARRSGRPEARSTKTSGARARPPVSEAGPARGGARTSDRRAGAGARPDAARSPSSDHLRSLYAQLEVPYGASFDEVKRAFRRLMRRYHPDLHAGDPKKHAAATQLSMTLNAAYRELELHLTRGKPRR